MTRQVFVTGGTGFVGANLVRLLLEEGYSVRALVRTTSPLDNLQNLDLEVIQGDLNDPNLWQQMIGCQSLFHVAAHYSLWQRDRDLLYQNNVLGTRNLLASAKRAGIERTVYTSSVAAIGVRGDGVPADETYQSPVERLIGHYKKSKYWAEQEAHQAVKAGQDVVIVNPTSPIGAWDIKPTPTGDLIRRFLHRQMPAYVDTGLNLIDVQDVARGHLLALQKGRTGERYILGHQNLTLKQILDRLSHLTGISAPSLAIPAWIPLGIAWLDERVLAPLGKLPSVPLDGVKMSTQIMFYDNTKAIQELGLPQSPIEPALKSAIDWFTNQPIYKPIYKQ